MNRSLLQRERERLQALNETWPWDGWDGAADARAKHHKLVLAQEAVVKKLEEEARFECSGDAPGHK